ncbi:MAG TPA: nuclear transport factor 2 family protein [Acidimicrobiales bacterium]|nr:nuclear transport factor 2 family protein [Acidimicrobiales bacterium]
MTTNREAAEAAYARFSDPGQGHAAVIDALHDDVVFECPFYDGFEPRVGKATVAAMMRRVDSGDESLFATERFPFHALHATDDPERFIIEAQGDHVIRATGKPYRNHYFHCLHVRNGKIYRWVEYSNPNEFHRAT